jgi:hypothetical protein
MFTRLLDSLDSGTQPEESFYDGYVVNAIIDACYRSARSKRWEAVELALWRGSREAGPAGTGPAEYDAEHLLLKQELMPDGRMKRILKEKKTGRIVERIG